MAEFQKNIHSTKLVPLRSLQDAENALSYGHSFSDRSFNSERKDAAHIFIPQFPWADCLQSAAFYFAAAFFFSYFTPTLGMLFHIVI